MQSREFVGEPIGAGELWGIADVVPDCSQGLEVEPHVYGKVGPSGIGNDDDCRVGRSCLDFAIGRNLRQPRPAQVALGAGSAGDNHRIERSILVDGPKVDLRAAGLASRVLATFNSGKSFSF